MISMDDKFRKMSKL